MTTHCRVLWAMSKSAWMAGRATFTMAMSSTTMNWAAQVRAKIRPVRAPAGCIGLLLCRLTQSDERSASNSTVHSAFAHLTCY